MGVAREDGVVHVKEHVAKAQRQDVTLDVHVRQAREVAVWLQERHVCLRFRRAALTN